MKKPPLVLIKVDRSIPQPIRLPAEHHAYTPTERASPVTTAQRWLGDRLEDRGESGYYLDGQPAKLDAIMRATNRVLKRHGQEQVTNSASWHID
jgi:hypothetical protein